MHVQKISANRNSYSHSECYLPSSAGTASAPHFGAGIKLSLLGIGGEAAIPITNKMDIRGGFNALSYSRNFDKDGVAYAGQLSFRTIEAHYDWFPFGGSFHLSPGMLVYNGNKVTANASVAGGQTSTSTTRLIPATPPTQSAARGKLISKKLLRLSP